MNIDEYVKKRLESMGAITWIKVTWEDSSKITFDDLKSRSIEIEFDTKVDKEFIKNTEEPRYVCTPAPKYRMKTYSPKLKRLMR